MITRTASIWVVLAIILGAYLAASHWDNQASDAPMPHKAASLKK